MLRRHFLPLLALPAAAQSPTLDWHSAQKLRIEGLGFKDRKSPYDLFPLRAEGVVRDAVWTLSRDSSGVLVRFLTSSASLHARWTLTSKNLASANITATAASGLDLYAETDAGRRQWLSIGKPTKFPDASDVLVAKLPPAPAAGREFMLYLPLRNGVTSLEIGVSPRPPSPPPRPAPLAANPSPSKRTGRLRPPSIQELSPFRSRNRVRCARVPGEEPPSPTASPPLAPA